MEDKWIIVDGELYHHGILGQKWHHRNGPPYPLDPSDYSKAEKKAAVLSNKNNGKVSIKRERKTTNGQSFNKITVSKSGKMDSKVDLKEKEKDHDDLYRFGKNFWKKYRESQVEAIEFLENELKEYSNFELRLYEDDKPNESEFNVTLRGNDKKMVIYGGDRGIDYYFLPNK